MAIRNCGDCDGSDQSDGCCNIPDDDNLPVRCVGDWSRDKLFYLERYCTIFASGMKNKWTNRPFVDLFSGPGRCRTKHQGGCSDGSPLIALRGAFTHYYLADLSQACTTALQSRVDARKKDCGTQSIEIFNGDCNLVVDTIHDRLFRLGPKTLAFAFVDPPGIQIHFDALRRLSAGIRMDFLINVPMGMNIKRQLTHRLADQKDGEMDSYFGTRRWREIVESDTGGAFGVRLLELYQSQLRTLGYRCFGQPKTVRSKAPLYELVFASKDERGAEFWEKVTKIGPTGQRELFG